MDCSLEGKQAAGRLKWPGPGEDSVRKKKERTCSAPRGCVLTLRDSWGRDGVLLVLGTRDDCVLFPVIWVSIEDLFNFFFFFFYLVLFFYNFFLLQDWGLVVVGW